MRCYRGLRAGTLGAVGLGLLMALGAHANTRERTGNSAPVESSVAHVATPSVAHAASAAGPVSEVNAQTVQDAVSPQITPWKKLEVHSGDSLSRLFARAGLKPREWAAVLDAGEKTEPLRHLHPGDEIEIRKTPDDALSELRYRLNAVDTLSVNRGNDGLDADIVHLHSQTRRLSASGKVDGSLSQSLARAGVPAAIATQLANIYRYRANLSRTMQPGDRFSVIYDAEYADNKRVAVGPIMAASITTGGENFKAFRAVDADGEAHYYDASGHAYEPSISRHPVAYKRISSPFNPNRMHPILHIPRPHNGVDMAAARGTPIHAAADGTVKFVGRKHGYGRLVELKHFDGYTTRYGHMSRFASSLHDGEQIKQGDIIGYVGATGEATGPHLHFEIRKDDVPHNPLTMQLPQGSPLSRTRLAAFTNRIQPLIAKLDDVPGMPNTLIASNAGLESRSSCAKAGNVNAALALAPGNALNQHSLADLFCVVSEDNAQNNSA